jgi:hypothetical protein
MPEFLKQFLTNLSDKDASAVWAYLDGSEAALEMIEVVCLTHEEMVRREGEKLWDKQ